MRRLGQILGILGVAIAAAACGASGGGTVPSQPASPLQGAAADHMRLDMMRLRLDDLGPNWRHQPPAAHQPNPCEPHPRNVEITAGNWKSRGVSFAFGTTAAIDSDAMVFATPADAQKTVAAYMDPSVTRCLERRVKKEFKDEKEVKLLGVSTSVLRRHKVADGLSGFRMVLNVDKGNRIYKLFIDYLMVRQDRALSEFSYSNWFSPVPISTEYTLANAVAQRGALSK